MVEIQQQLSEQNSSSGQSGRTLQNDLRKLTELGYAEWVKDGSARRYTIKTGVSQ